ncbi:MAG: C25 family peptidase propeptide domain-containing protein, partial [bacterium]
MRVVFQKLKWLVYFYLICQFSLIWGKSSPKLQAFQLLEFNSNRVVFAIKPFELAVKPLKIDDQTYQQIFIADYGLSARPGYPQLPSTGALIPVPAEGEVKVTVIESAYKDMRDIAIPPAPDRQQDLSSEQVSYAYQEDVAVYHVDAFWPAKAVEFCGRAQLRGQSIGRIQVNPVQYNPVQKILRIIKTLKIQVTFSQPLKSRTKGGKVNPDIFENLTQSLYITPQLRFESDIQRPSERLDLQQNDWYNPQFTYYKLFINEEGIYELTYDDLLQAGVPTDLFSLNQLKIYHQGQQIPLWITGPQVGTFTPDNRVYFYGDWHHGTETYFDFYTDTNVYWLTTDGAAGERYQLIEKSNLNGNPVQFYWQTLHLEQDWILHQSNKSSARDADEGWVWRYFFDDDKEVIDFEVNALEEAAPVCSLTVRLQGTTKDPVNPDHH